MDALLSLLDVQPQAAPRGGVQSAISGGISPSPDIFVKSSISKPGLLVKVAVLGGTRAGKSTMIKCFCDDVKAALAGAAAPETLSRHAPTIGMDVHTVRLGTRQGREFCVQLCEIPFQEAHAAVAGMRVQTGFEPSARSESTSDRSINQISSALRGAHAVLIAYDASAGSSFQDVDTCIDAVSMLWPRGCGSMALVACKSDIRHTGDASYVTDEDIRAYCTATGFTQHWQCSYKHGAADHTYGSMLTEVILAALAQSNGKESMLPAHRGTAAARRRSAAASPGRRDAYADIPGIVTGTPRARRTPTRDVEDTPIGQPAPTLTAWMDSVQLSTGSKHGFMKYTVAPDATTARAARMQQAARIMQPPTLSAALWSANANVGVDDLVHSTEDTLSQVSAIASSVLLHQKSRTLPQLTTITLPTQDKLSALPTATLMHCASQLLDPKCASNGSHSFASTVTLSTTSQFTTTSFCSAPFPQPFVSIQGKPIRYDDDDAGDATDSEMIAHRFDSGLRALSSWFAAFTAQCEIFATETKAAGVFPRRLFALWTEHTQSIHAGLTEFGELRRVGIEDLQRLGTFRLDLLQECAEWHAVFHDIHCSGARPADISTADSVLA